MNNSISPYENEETLKQKIERTLFYRNHCIETVMKCMGWSRIKAILNIEDARKRLGINYKTYEIYQVYKIPKEKQKHEVDKILKLIEENEKLDKRNAHNKQVRYRKTIMKKMGWTYDEYKEKYQEAMETCGCMREEFYCYKLYELSKEEMKAYFTQGLTKYIKRKYITDEKTRITLGLKVDFDKQFEKYLGRPFCDLQTVTLNEFKEKFKDSDRILYKPLVGFCGKGITSYYINEDTIEDVFNELKQLPPGLVEGYLIQHEDMARLSKNAVNTLRITTMNGNEVCYVTIRIAGKDAIVDNFHSGGFCAAVDVNTGIITTDGIDIDCNVYKETSTGIPVKGYQIPCFKEAIEMTLEASKNIKGYVGWDVAISKDGPVLIECNTRPGAVLLQMPYIPEKKGMRHVMEKYI